MRKINSQNHIMSTYDAPISCDELGITWEEADRYIQGWEIWEKSFSQRTLEWIVENLSIGDICAVHYVPECQVNDNNYYENHYERECAVRSHSFEEYQGNTDFHRTVYLPAIGYRVPYRYQQVGKLKTIYREALIRDYPYLKDYKFESYVPQFANDPNQIYVKFTFDYKGEKLTKTLYVPIEALKEKRSEKIVKRHYDYHVDYYRTNLEEREKALAVLTCDAFDKFRHQVDDDLN